VPRLRDRATLLVPQRKDDPNNANVKRFDWTVEPDRIDVPFEAQQQRSGGDALEPGSAIASWSAWLPTAVRLPVPEDAEEGTEPVVVDLVSTFHAGCRMEWHGREYSVDGPIRSPRKGGRVEFLAFTMKRADARAAA
jgi:hypothetical protein